MASAKAASEPRFNRMPTAAGMIVVGNVPRNPPSTPPHFSIARVTPMATVPAKKAETMTTRKGLMQNG
jgi:hypothetical protein